MKRYNLKMKLSISLIFFLLTPQYLFAKGYSLEWYGELKHEQSIEFPSKSIYKIINSFGYWEDNKGNYGSLNCLGWVKNIKNNELLEVSCEAIDNEEEEFWFILNRDSEEGAGVGQARYIEGTGKYKSFIGKVCPYAINYSQGGFFYKQICN